MLEGFLRRFRPWLTPVVRGYLRYSPVGLGKMSLWERVVNPFYAWEPYEFEGRTLFGPRMAGNTRDILQQHVYYFGIWEPDTTYWMSRRLKPGDGFIDVGSNVGYYALLASRLVGPTGCVVAIEASPTICRQMEKNFAINGMKNVRAVNVAASDREGTLKLYSGPDEHTGLTTVVAMKGLKPECEIRAAPLSTILTEEEVAKTRLVKIDVEGAEGEVAAGMGPLLEKGRKDLEILLEVHVDHLKQQGKTPESVLKVFEDAGFRAYLLENDYSARCCMARQHQKKLPRFRGPIDREMNLVLSRMDADEMV